MEKHVSNYMKAFGYSQGDFIACEHCGSKSVDIHHVEPRSKFGSKRKEEQDAIENLIALCRDCHTNAHGVHSDEYKRLFKYIINQRYERPQTKGF